MQSTRSLTPVMDCMLVELERHGYRMEPIAVNAALVGRPKGFAMVVRFGDRMKGFEYQVAAALEVGIDIQGDIRTGKVRRWRISRIGPVQDGSMPAIHLEANLTLDGDISADFVGREGKAGFAMLQSLIGDARTTLCELSSVHCAQPARRPVVHMDVKVAGDVAVGRSGLLRTNDGVQLTTPAVRDSMLAICDRFATGFLPELMIAGAAVVTRARPPRRRLPALQSVHAAEAMPT